MDLANEGSNSIGGIALRLFPVVRRVPRNPSYFQELDGGKVIWRKAWGVASDGVITGLVQSGLPALSNSGILYLSDFRLKPGWPRPDMGSLMGMAGRLIPPFGLLRAPKKGCGGVSPFAPILGYGSARGYQYDIPKTGGAGQKQKKFSLMEFLKETAVGGITGGVASAGFYGAGRRIETLTDGFRGGKGNIRTMPDPYDGVKQASEYLQSQGVPREYRKQVLESFDIESIRLQTAGENTYGLRFYGGKANAEERYLFETFTPLTNRKNLALPYEWNSMTGIQQFQVRNGTVMITGNAAAQNNWGSQYVGGAKQWYINNLGDLIKCQ